MKHVDLEQFIADVSPIGDPVAIPLDLFPQPDVILPEMEFEDDDNETNAVQIVELMSLDGFTEQWGMMHDMAGGMIGMRTGSPCPLGDQARSEGGRVACKAAFGLIESNPALSRLILSTESTFFGQVAAVGMHGFACVQVVKASRAMPTQPQDMGEFKHHE